jgi:hypothetical protein
LEGFKMKHAFRGCIGYVPPPYADSVSYWTARNFFFFLGLLEKLAAPAPCIDSCHSASCLPLGQPAPGQRLACKGSLQGQHNPQRCFESRIDLERHSRLPNAVSNSSACGRSTESCIHSRLFPLSLAQLGMSPYTSTEYHRRAGHFAYLRHRAGQPRLSRIRVQCVRSLSVCFSLSLRIHQAQSQADRNTRHGPTRPHIPHSSIETGLCVTTYIVPACHYPPTTCFRRCWMQTAAAVPICSLVFGGTTRPTCRNALPLGICSPYSDQPSHPLCFSLARLSGLWS